MESIHQHSTTVRSAHTVFMCLYLSRTHSELCHLQHKLIGFYNRDGITSAWTV
jgi:hypothetical protein